MKSKISFFISSLNGGGSARVLLNLAERYSAQASIEILTLEEPDGFYTFPTAIKVRVLDTHINGPFKSIRHYFKLWNLLRNYIKNNKPDEVVSFIHISNVVMILAAVGLPTKVIVSERSDLQKTRIHTIWKFLRHLTYPFADKIILQNKDDRAYFSAKISSKIHVCENPLTKQPFPSSTSIKKRIITLGRLHPVKRFDLLITLLAPILENHPEWNLTICGEGSQKNMLEDLADHLKVKSQVIFMGQVTDSWGALAESSIFVMTSESEGSPNSLIEASIIGLPSVCFNTSTCFQDLASHFSQIKLIPEGNHQAFVDYISNLMESSSYQFNSEEAKNVFKIWNEKALLNWDNIIIGHQLKI